MKKVLFENLGKSFLICLIWGGLGYQVSAATETVKIYPTDDAQAQLYDQDGFTDWNSARNFQGLIFREPYTSGVLNNVGNIGVRSDKHTFGYYRIYRVSKTFNLNLLPEGSEIISANLNLYRTTANTHGNIDVVVTSHKREDIDRMQKQDWNIKNFGWTSFAKRKVDGVGYNSFIFNDPGIAYLNDGDSGMVTLGLLSAHDFYDVEPPLSVVSAGWHELEKDGTEFDPYLEITYEIPDEQENEFPLYTQIESLYPSLGETADWEDDVYAYGSQEWCGDTIGGCGCAITSGVMAGRNAGITTDVVGRDVNPKNINEYLRAVGGYTSDGSVYWLAMQAYLGELVDGKLATRFKYEGAAGGSQIARYLETEGEYAVLAFKDSLGHFVWLPGKTDAGYIVRDPFWYLTETSHDTNGTNVKNYSDSFDSARVFEILDEAEAYSGDGMEMYLKGTAELVYKDVTGNTVGYTEDGVVIDIDNSSYGNAEVIGLNGVPSSETDGRHLLVYDAQKEFTIDVIGTGFGEFEVELFTISETGEVETFAFSGQTIPGVTSTFTINLETGEVTEEPISYEQFLDILDITMEGYTEQQRVFFLKWAEKIYGNMEGKTVSQALQGIEVYKKLLVAKKVESQVLHSVLDLLTEQVGKK